MIEDNFVDVGINGLTRLHNQVIIPIMPETNDIKLIIDPGILFSIKSIIFGMETSLLSIT